MPRFAATASTSEQPRQPSRRSGRPVLTNPGINLDPLATSMDPSTPPPTVRPVLT